MTIREVDSLARAAGLPSIRSSRWELKPAFKHYDEVSRVTDSRALVRLRAAISTWGGPRTHGYTLAATGLALAIASVALAYAQAGSETAAVEFPGSLYVLLGLSFGVGVVLLGLLANDRESTAAGWMYLLDERLATLRSLEAQGRQRPALVEGHAEFIALKIGGGKRRS